MPKKNGPRTCGPCGCPSSGPSIPGCACTGSPSQWDMHWNYYAYDYNGGSEYLNSDPLTYYPARPAYTKAGIDPETPPSTYTEWGPGWYSGLIDHDVAGRPNGSLYTPPTAVYHSVFRLQCSGNRFTLTVFQNYPSPTAKFGSGTIVAAWVLGATGGNMPGDSGTYATGPNTCTYFYTSRWNSFGGKPNDGISSPKNGGEYYLTPRVTP